MICAFFVRLGSGWLPLAPFLFLKSVLASGGSKRSDMAQPFFNSNQNTRFLKFMVELLIFVEITYLVSVQIVTCYRSFKMVTIFIVID